MNSMTFLILGMVLTAIGIVFTVIGTFKQGEEAEAFQNQVIESQNKSIELSEKLAKISEEKFNKLTKAELNVIDLIEIENNESPYFKIKTKNTGNNDAFNCELIIDKHNSPLVSISEIQLFKKIPKDEIMIYNIPILKSSIFNKIAHSNDKDEFEIFKDKFYKNEIPVIIFFHFEFEWNNQKYKSSQYSIVKEYNRRPYVSTSENYIDTQK